MRALEACVNLLRRPGRMAERDDARALPRSPGAHHRVALGEEAFDQRLTEREHVSLDPPRVEPAHHVHRGLQAPEAREVDQGLLEAAGGRANDQVVVEVIRVLRDAVMADVRRPEAVQSRAPGAAIFLTTLGFNFLGDAIRDALDPTARG
jgi:hypothetical protein